jgi:hypothetical protein
MNPPTKTIGIPSTTLTRVAKMEMRVDLDIGEDTEGGGPGAWRREAARRRLVDRTNTRGDLVIEIAVIGLRGDGSRLSRNFLQREIIW